MKLTKNNKKINKKSGHLAVKIMRTILDELNNETIEDLKIAIESIHIVELALTGRFLPNIEKCSKSEREKK